MGKRVERTRNLGTETESEHMGKIRSTLRHMSRFWKPALEALNKVKRPYYGPNKRQKYEFECEGCRETFMRKDVQINHIVPCGTLTKYEDVPLFLQRLFCENVEGYNVLCTSCHKGVTKTQREL
jgi:hypothetical protein